MADEAAHRGPSSVTVARVIARAGVSRRAFYELFADVEDCLLATLDWAIELARARAQPAYARERAWREAVRAGLAALLRFFDENPLLAQLCIVHAPAGGPRVLERRSDVLAELCEVVDRGRERVRGRQPPGLVAEGVVGAVVAVLYGRLLAPTGPGAGRSRGSSGAERSSSSSGAERSPDSPGAGRQAPLIDLHGQLMSLIVLPYLGSNAAARELERPPPAPPIDALVPEAPTSARAMLELPHGRLTYRTVRVLRAIAECPGGSNRDVASRADIVDQGQISKILARLQEQAMVVNRGGSSHTRGTPNAWWLTERGEALEHALRDTAADARREEPSSAGESPAPRQRAGSRRGARGRQPGNGSGARRPGM
jgi:AcrR family transcriptional regulator/DNA-binding MarR family transcriptional regulator